MGRYVDVVKSQRNRQQPKPAISECMLKGQLAEAYFTGNFVVGRDKALSILPTDYEPTTTQSP